MTAMAAARKLLPAIVRSCTGSADATRLAADVAARLARRGLGELHAGDDLEGLARAARGGRPVIAVDGCASGCCTQLLEARGVRPAHVIRLHELGAPAGAGLSEREREELAARAAERLAAGTPPAQARPRPAPPRRAERSKQAHTVEDYLLAIHTLSSPVVACGAVAREAPTLAAHVSQVLGVSRPSAGQMLGRLETEGLVERSDRKEVLLTAAGREAADRAVRRHRLLERFVTDFLGYAPADAYERARLLARSLDDETVERIAERLDSPERCPHGWPVDPELEREESRELSSLPALAPGARATVVRLAEHDVALLARLYERGLAPGAELEVESVEPAADEIAVRAGGTLLTLSGRAAADVFVRAI